MSEQNNYSIDHNRESTEEYKAQEERFKRREQVRSELQKLLQISMDPYYTQYVTQMMKDLESGKATPDQVEQEARRSYEKYKQRMEQKEKPQNTMEYKIGIHVFSMIGAIFVLVAFVIFGFNFMNGLAQGICLYLAALVLILISEGLLYRKMPAFSNVITGIGVGGLYIANLVNYLVLHTMNGIAAMLITLVIACGTILYGRKRESTTIRLISLLGYYICLFPIKGFGSEWDFMVFTGMLFIVNMVCLFVQNQKNRIAIGSVHLAANIIFTTAILGVAWRDGISAVYLVTFLVTSFMVTELMAYMQCRGEKEAALFPFICIGNGLHLFMLFLAGNMGEGMADPAFALFVHLIAEILVVVVCILAFLFWNREDGRRWAQVYLGAGAVLLLSSFSEYHLEIIVAELVVLLAVKLFNRHKEIVVLECIVAGWVGFTGLWLSDYWYCWIFAAALLAASLCVRYLPVYHEVVTTISILLIWWSQCIFYFDDLGLEGKWLYPISAGILLLLLILFHHIPQYREYNQKPYSIFNIVLMAAYYLIALFVRDTILSAVMLALGAVTIILVFGKKYDMYIPKRYYVLIGFLALYSLLGYFSSPVIVSIILMVTALVSVGIGFKQMEKAARICGLVMAIFVCLKLVLYDFREVETLYRMLVFLVVGILALVISFLYIFIEKNVDKKKEAQGAEEVPDPDTKTETVSAAVDDMQEVCSEQKEKTEERNF